MREFVQTFVYYSVFKFDLFKNRTSGQFVQLLRVKIDTISRLKIRPKDNRKVLVFFKPVRVSIPNVFQYK